MEDFWLLFVADDAAGAVVEEVLERAPREDFLTLIFVGRTMKCGLLQDISQAVRMEADKRRLQDILRHIFGVAVLFVKCLETGVCSWEFLAAEKSSSGK